MRRIITGLVLLAAATLVSACGTTDNLRAGEKGAWIAANGASYDKVWQAARTVMARRLTIVEADAETGRMVAVSDKDRLFWREGVAFFVQPTESNDNGYMVDFDAMTRPWFLPPTQDWRKALIADLKKELAATR